jgi:hypothetical protein
MIPPMKMLAFLVPVLGLVSCAGYQLGGVKPASLTQVKSIAVPMFGNSTLHPRAEALATSAVANAFVLDGTYRLAGADQADAVLQGKLSSIKYAPIRSTRLNTLHPEELANTVTLRWSLRDAKDHTKILASGTSSGSSELYVADNLQTARNNALPDALDRAAQALVSTLSNGY